MAGITFNYNRPNNTTDAEWADLVKTALSKLKEKTPVRTGTLQSSWIPESTNKKSMSIKNDTEYAEYVDGGNTKGMSPRNMRQQTEAELDAIAQSRAIKSIAKGKKK